MAKKKIEISGYYQDEGIVRMHKGHIVDLQKLSDKKEMPKIPYGTKVELTINYEEIDFLNGSNGIVWATYSYRQADTIKNALFIQNIFGEITESELVNTTLYKILVANPKEVEEAIDFIWRDENGLKLEPDWSYSKHEENKSFNKWLNGE